MVCSRSNFHFVSPSSGRSRVRCSRFSCRGHPNALVRFSNPASARLPTPPFASLLRGFSPPHSWPCSPRHGRLEALVCAARATVRFETKTPARTFEWGNRAHDRRLCGPGAAEAQAQQRRQGAPLARSRGGRSGRSTARGPASSVSPRATGGGPGSTVAEIPPDIQWRRCRMAGESVDEPRARALKCPMSSVPPQRSPPARASRGRWDLGTRDGAITIALAAAARWMRSRGFWSA